MRHIRAARPSRWRLPIVAAATLASAGVFTFAPGTASAAGQYDCQVGKTCLWVNASFGGVRLYTSNDLNSLSPYNFNDRASSGYNRLTVLSTNWKNIDCNGPAENLAAGVARAQLYDNDDASSLDVFGQSACGY